MTTFLLYVLLSAFILLEVPLLFLLIYLFQHRQEDGLVGQIRTVIFWVTLVKALFMFGEILIVGAILLRITFLGHFFLWLFCILTSVLCVTNWWALFKIRQIQEATLNK